MSTFNDDLSADMSDPEFAAEFERTTDEVRRERYAAAIAAADDMRKDWCYAEADAAMALANEEIGGLAQELVEMGGDLSARRREVTRLRADLQESADALDESAQLLEDALDENARLRTELEQTHARGSATIEHLASEVTRLRAELEDVRRVSDQWAKAHGARSAETSIARDENTRLRAELEEQKRLHENFKKGTDAGGKEMRRRLTAAEDTISRVRAVLARWRDGDVHYPYLAVRDALNGES